MSPVWMVLNKSGPDLDLLIVADSADFWPDRKVKPGPDDCVYLNNRIALLHHLHVFGLEIRGEHGVISLSLFESVFTSSTLNKRPSMI